MSTQALQVSRELRVIPSDNCNIPHPAGLRSSGTNTTATALKLIDSTATFRTNQVQVGDIVYNTTGLKAAMVMSIDSETQLTLNATIFTGTGNAYSLYNGESNSNGCLFYTGGAGSVAHTTTGNDTNTKNGCAAGEYHPVHIIKIFETGTTATSIDAHW